LQGHPKTGEPYLRLPAPLDNIILTPPRMTDADATVAIMNDEGVAMKLASPPYPYLHEHAISWLEKETERNRCAMEEIDRATRSSAGEVFFSECPVQSIREEKEDGEEVYIGDVRLARTTYFNILDGEEAKRLEKMNSEKPAGDPGIEWAFGDYLAPSHHGKGIMTAAIKTVMEWAVPNMGVRHIVVTADKRNNASVRVFEKNGYTHLETLENCKRHVESKGGQLYSLRVMEWRKPE